MLEKNRQTNKTIEWKFDTVLKFFLFSLYQCFFFFIFIFIQDVVNMFASVPDPDYPGHVILEQFQAQVRNGNSLYKLKKVAVLHLHKQSKVYFI